MYLFFQTKNFELLIFCMDNQDIVNNSFMFSHIISSKFFDDIVTFSFFFFDIPGLCLFNMHVSVELIDCFLLLSLARNAILLTSSANTLCLLLVRFWYWFIVFMNYVWFSLRLFTSGLIFGGLIISISIWIASKQFL